LPGSTSKKVVIHRFQREALTGFINPQSWLQPAGIEMITPSGALLFTPYEEIKVVSFVINFDGPTPFQERRRFQTRPKHEGLWVRAQFHDNDFQEGILPNDLLAASPYGFQLSPPDPNSNNQSLFLPKASLKEVHVLAVSGASGRRKKQPPTEEQIGLFD